MTIDELETFLTIARLGSFAAASRALARSQPAISRRIQQLEDGLGAELFQRTARRTGLTDAGRALLPHAEAALAAVRDAERALRDLGDSSGRGQQLELAIVGTLADSRLVDALRAFESERPEASVRLRTATSPEVSQLVREGRAHLGLRYFEDADPALEAHRLGAERLHLIVPASHPLRQSRLRDLSKLEDARWLGFASERDHPEGFGHLLERALVAGGIARPDFTRVDSLTAQKRLIEAGLGVALMPLSSVREELRIGSLRAIALVGQRAEIPVFAIERRRGYRSPLAREFLARLRAHPPGGLRG